MEFSIKENAMNKDSVRQVLVVLAFALTLTVNGLANGLPLNGYNTGQISDMFVVYFVPAGYVFSIWGVIYLFLAGFAIYQALPSQRENPLLRSIGYLFVLNCLANSAWIFFWHYLLFPWTLLMMLIILASLIVIYLRLDIGRSRASAAETWLVRVPFSIYLGWITVATIANVTDLLEYWSWNGWGIFPEHWAVIMLAVATLLAALVSFTRRDVAFLLVLIWAFAGIGVKQAETAVVANAAWTATGLVALILVVGYFWRRPKPVASS
jgi:hypothetical protein